MSPLAPLAAAPASTPRADIAKAAQGFEAIFVRQMLSAARQSHFGDETLMGGQGMETFRQMQDDRFADIAAERGAFGLAKMIAVQLARQIGAAVSERASTGSARAGLEIGSYSKPAQAEPVEAHAQPQPGER